MAEDNVAVIEDGGQPSAAINTSTGREVSTIQFPYSDLNGAVEVARKVHDKDGDRCSIDLLAPWMGYSNVVNGTFRSRLSAARIFGLIDIGDAQTIVLTTLGRDIISPERERQARAQAFLKVALYKALYDRYRGYQLPPVVGLERAIQDLGVPSKQKARARQTMQRAAEQAGFFEQGRDRLVIPPDLPTQRLIDIDEGHSRNEEARPPNSGNGDGGTGYTFNPFIQGLINALPEPGTEWPEAQQKEWLETAAQIFKFIYKKSNTREN